MKKLFKVFLVTAIMTVELCFAVTGYAPQVTSSGGPDGPVVVGNTVVFFVNVAANPIAMGEWYRNGQPLSPAANIWMTQNGNAYILTWQNVPFEASGDIDFIATNIFGKTSCKFDLNVMLNVNHE